MAVFRAELLLRQGEWIFMIHVFIDAIMCSAEFCEPIEVSA